MANAWIIKPVPIVAASASGTAPGHDAAYVGNDHIGVVWKSPVVANPSITIDLGHDEAIDTALLLGLTGAAAGWMLSVDAATSAQGAGFPGGSYDGATQDLLAGSAMPTSGRGIALWSPEDAPSLARYMRFAIGQGSTAPVTIGRIVAGKRIALDRNFSFGAAFGVRDLGAIDFSTSAVLLRRKGRKLRTVGLTFSSIHKDELEEMIRPLLENVGNTDPIALITDPAANPLRQQRIYFGFLVGDLNAVWRVANGFEWRANLVSIV